MDRINNHSPANLIATSLSIYGRTTTGDIGRTISQCRDVRRWASDELLRERIRLVMQRVRNQSKSRVAERGDSVSTGANAGNEFDSWAETQQRVSGCSVCRDQEATQTVNALLEAMIRKRAYKVTVHEIHKMVSARHADANIGHRGLERHLLTCVREVYDRARGRAK